MSNNVIIGSRGSDLALWQANFFQSKLEELGVNSEIKIITTKGDRIQNLSFDKIEGKGFFTKEIEQALLDGEIDVAVHSHKDLETRQPDGLKIAAVSYRENPSDLLLIRKSELDISKPLGLKKGAVVGTSSARRKAQITDLRHDIELKDIRGNVPTRINKLRSGDFDAIILADAGVSRLNLDLSDIVVNELDPQVFVPAAAQGVLAFQCREEDDRTTDILKQLHHSDVFECIDIERSILSQFGGGCHIPIGVFVKKEGDGFDVRVSFGEDWSLSSRRAYLKANTKEDALSNFERISKMSLPKTALITKQYDDSSALVRSCADHNISLTQRPLIEVNSIPFEMPSDFEWVFFSSSNGVKAFFEKEDVASLSDKKLGAYGASTARTLAQFVSQIDFIASPGQPSDVAMELSKVVGDQRVLFPTSDITIGSMRQFLKPEQCSVLPVYKTELVDVKLGESYEAYIFTSPSNVRSFFTSNKIPPNSKVIAMGQSTTDALSELGCKSQTAACAHEVELFTLLCS